MPFKSAASPAGASSLESVREDDGTPPASPQTSDDEDAETPKPKPKPQAGEELPAAPEVLGSALAFAPLRVLNRQRVRRGEAEVNH